MQPPVRVKQNQKQKYDYENPVRMRFACPDSNQHDGSGANDQVRVNAIVTREEKKGHATSNRPHTCCYIWQV